MSQNRYNLIKYGLYAKNILQKNTGGQIMKYNVNVVFIDKNTHEFIEHDAFSDGELSLRPVEDEGVIDILLKVNEIMLDDHVYLINSRRYSIDKRKLYIVVERINRRT